MVPYLWITRAVRSRVGWHWGAYPQSVAFHDAFRESKGDPPTRCIVYGMPGLGKTQVALKYAELASKEKRCPYIFWISSASIDKLTTPRLHDPVQLVLRTKLMSAAKEQKRWLLHTIHILCRAFEMIEPSRSPSWWDQRERFVAHLRVLLRYGDKYGVDSIELWDTCS